MATAFLSNANIFLHSLSCSSSSSSVAFTTSTSVCARKHNVRIQLTLSKAMNELPLSPLVLTKRGISLALTTTFLFSLAGKKYHDANAAILEADDDVELLEKVKNDRKRRLEKQGVLNSSNKERAYLQDLVYNLSKVGQAIENNDLSAATSVLGQSTETDWVQKANAAFNKLSSSPEEKNEVDSFNSALASLISSVIRNDVDASKTAFVSSASAFEKWTNLTGLTEQLKGF